MSSTVIDLGDELARVLEQLHSPLQQSAREMIVLELYRRTDISSGKAAELLGMRLMDFIRYSGELGIPFFRMTAEEWQAELESIRSLYP